MLDYGAKRVVFLGDAVNDWYASDSFEIATMEFYADWVKKQRDNGIVVDVLLGNHDYCYIQGITLTSPQFHSTNMTNSHGTTLCGNMHVGREFR